MAALHPGPCHSRLVDYRTCESIRRGSASSFSSSSDDDDIITPCPRESSCTEPQPESQRTQAKGHDSPQTQGARPQRQRPKSWRDGHWHFDPLDSEGDEADPTMLWRTMLTIQRVFGCYNSARMRAALEMGDELAAVPPKICLDLLNDSITQLPEDARRQLNDFLVGESGSIRRSTSSWKRRFVHHPA